jgi:hypothetical protein
LNNQVKKIATAYEAMALVHELKSAGLYYGQDYEWEFHPSINDRFTGPPDPSYVLFTFNDESTATFYELKWL